MKRLNREKKWKGLKTVILGIFVIFAAVLSMVLCPEYGLADDVTLTKAEIMMSEQMSPVHVSPGDEKEIRLPVKVVGTGYMNDPSITIDTSGLPFEVTSEITMQSKNGAKINDLSGTTSYVCFRIRIDSDAKKGNYKFAVDFTGADTDNQRYTTTLDNPVIIHVDEQKKKAPSMKLELLHAPDAIKKGDAFEVSFSLKNTGEQPAVDVKLSFDELAAAGIRTASGSDTVTIDQIPAGATQVVSQSLKAGQDVTEGTKKLAIKLSWKNEQEVAYSDSQNIFLHVEKQEEQKARLRLSQIRYKEEVQAGDKFNLTFKMDNIGGNTAYRPSLSLEDLAGAGILPDYSNDRVELSQFPAGRSDNIKIPLTVSPSAEPGVKKVTLRLSYYDSKDAQSSLEFSTSIYITVKNNKAAIQSNLVIYNMRQSVSVPKPGDVVTVSFDVQNKGKTDAIRVKLMPVELSNKTVSPADQKPYAYIQEIKAGETKHVSMQFQIEQIAEKGVVNINLDISYRDTISTEYTEKATLYILNVQNEDTSGVPKLIISDYDLGADYLKAGEEFVFSFDVNNTHKTLSADNIKVTISSENNVFSITKGSNSFYIDHIAPGETVNSKIRLRVKADCVSKAYPITVAFEYEYEGMQKPEKEISTGLKISEILNFQVMEIARPKIDNIVVGTYDQPVEGEPATMNFDFYNLGKSTLYNVTAKIKCDGLKAAKSTVFIGNTEAGKGQTYEMEVTPLVGGQTVDGVLIVTYEDSNGTRFKTKQKFSAEIGMQEAVSMDDMMDFDMGEEQEEKPILELWQFIAGEILLFIVSIVAVSRIVKGVRKKQLIRNLEKENEEDED